MVEQAEVDASRPDPTSSLRLRQRRPDISRSPINKVMPEESRAAAADQLLAFTCCWPDLSDGRLDPAAWTRSRTGPAASLAADPAAARTLRDVVKEAQVAAATNFGPSAASSWWRWGRVSLRQRAHCANGERRTQPPAGCVAVSPTHARHPTKLARIDGALVPLSPRSLPPASRTAGSFRSSAKAGDWRRMGFLLTDRSEVA